LHEIIKTCLRAEASAINNIPAENGFLEATDVFFSHVHEKNGKIIVCGMGKAGQIAENIATTFCSTGSQAVFLHPSNAQHGDLGILSKNDALLLISNSGKTREILELVDLARNLYAQIPIVVITGNPESALAKLADIVISTGNPPEVCPLGLTPTTSTTTMTVIGDILVVLLMDRINFTAADYSKLHHGGYLGAKSRDIASAQNL